MISSRGNSIYLGLILVILYSNINSYKASNSSSFFLHSSLNLRNTYLKFISFCNNSSYECLSVSSCSVRYLISGELEIFIDITFPNSQL